MAKRFMTDKANGKFMGVCAGIAEYFGWDVTVVRIAFVLAVFLPFHVHAPLIYLITGLVAQDRSAQGDY